jgi:hypothetical protein
MEFRQAKLEQVFEKQPARKIMAMKERVKPIAARRMHATLARHDTCPVARAFACRKAGHAP